MKTVAILGASADHHKFGNKSVRAHAAAGWRVIPVNPKETTIEGLPVARSLAEVPKPIDRVSVYLPPAVSRTLLAEMKAAGAKEVFFNPGAADEALIAEAKRLGIPAIDACSIVDLGLSPADFP